MCDPWLGAPRKRATKLFSLWRHRHDFPAAQWRNLLGQTLARCVALRKQVERQVVQLHDEAAEYLQSGLLHRADDKGNNNVLTSASSHKSWIEPWRQPSLKKLVKVKSRSNVLAPYSSGKSCGKNPSSRSRKCSIECMHQPSQRKLNEVKAVHPAELGIKKSSDQEANKKKEYGLQAAIQNDANATLTTQAFNELSKIHVSSDGSDSEDGEGASNKPSRPPEFEEVKAQLMALKKIKQPTQ